MSLMTSWYLCFELTRPACSRVLRFLRIFLFFCSRGSWRSSSMAWLLFNPSGVWESCTTCRSTSLACSASYSTRERERWLIEANRLNLISICWKTDLCSIFIIKSRAYYTCEAEAGVSRISVSVSPGWILTTSTISFFVLQSDRQTKTRMSKSVIWECLMLCIVSSVKIQADIVQKIIQCKTTSRALTIEIW